MRGGGGAACPPAEWPGGVHAAHGRHPHAAKPAMRGCTPPGLPGPSSPGLQLRCCAHSVFVAQLSGQRRAHKLAPQAGGRSEVRLRQGGGVAAVSRHGGGGPRGPGGAPEHSDCPGAPACAAIGTRGARPAHRQPCGPHLPALPAGGGHSAAELHGALPSSYWIEGCAGGGWPQVRPAGARSDPGSRALASNCSVQA